MIINFTPNSNSGDKSPIQLALGKRLSMSQLKNFSFGEIVVAKTQVKIKSLRKQNLE
jgi:hypothetical protein